ncbi:phage tail length tape measure family protein [Escherichia coli]|uniref:phage tail length tape measure family protein n=1 Tax=Escherichia coli TaxID=562 RepID=UPI00388F4878
MADPAATGAGKDSFGGMIHVQGLAGAITPADGGGHLAGGGDRCAGVCTGIRGNSTLSDFNKTLVLSGNQAGLTADRMLVLSRAGQAAGLTFQPDQRVTQRTG